MSSQTICQKADALRIGSCKVEIGETEASLVNIGATDGDTTLQEQWELIIRMSANAGELSRGIKKGSHKAIISGNWLEIDLANLKLLRGGIDKLATVAGAQVTGYAQVVLAGSWSFDKFIPFEHQNHDGAKIVPTSVVGSTDDALVAGTDYFIIKSPAGIWGIAVPDSTTVTTESQNLTITYNYTPAASVEFSTGGAFTISPRVLRLTNTNEAGKSLVGTFFKGYNMNGLSLAFHPDEDGNYMISPFQVECVCDESRPAKEQLFKLVDSQNV